VPASASLVAHSGGANRTTSPVTTQCRLLKVLAGLLLWLGC
jgi:hypothetical protein